MPKTNAQRLANAQKGIITARANGNWEGEKHIGFRKMMEGIVARGGASKGGITKKKKKKTHGKHKPSCAERRKGTKCTQKSGASGRRIKKGGRCFKSC